MYIILIFFSLIALLPFIWVIFLSFMNTSEIFSGAFFPTTWRYTNYPEAWRQARLAMYFTNSLFVVLVAPTLGVTLETLTGYSFAKLRLRKYTWLFYIFLIGLFIPTEANLLSIMIQTRTMGMHNTLMGLSLAIVGSGMAFGCFLMRNFFRDIPDSFGESAKIDGAGIHVIFLFIYLPLAKSGIIALAIFRFIGAWNEYNLSLFILTNSNRWTIPLAVALFRVDLGGRDFGLVFAATVICILPILFFYILFQRSFVEGISAGGVKG